LSFTESGNVKKANVGRGSVLISNDLETTLPTVHVRKEAIHENGIKLIKRKHENGYYYFIANWSDKAVNGWVPLQTDASSSVAIFDPMTEKTGYADLRKNGDAMEVFLQMEKGESLILVTNNSQSAIASYPYVSLQQPQEIKGDWTINFVKGGPILPKTIHTNQLESWTNLGGNDLKNFSGTASYTTTFKRPDTNGDVWILDLGQVSESATVLLNGKPLGTTIGPVYKLEVPSSMLTKENNLEIRVSNSMANRIAYMDKNQLPWKIFYNINMPARLPENRGKDGLFTAEKWQPKSSGLLGPVTLTPVIYKNTEVKVNKM
jgi:hypothetical protein